MPRIAVITPTYNRGHNGLLLKAMRSVSGQSYPDYMHIVVDHCSTDNTEEVVRGFPDSRVIYERISRDTTKRHSSSVANNHVIRMIREDKYFSGVKYVTFLHSDDMLPADSFKDRMAAFDDGILMTYGYTGVCNSDMRLISAIEGPRADPKAIAKELKRRWYVSFPHHTLMLRKGFLEEVGEFDERLYAYEDTDFSARTLGSLDRLQFRQVPKIVYYYRNHDDNITTHSGSLLRSDVRQYFDRKHGRTLADAMVETAERFVKRPHAFLPEPVKRLLRPVRDGMLARRNGSFTDPYIEAIENHPEVLEIHN